jgi:hypothetical protein
MRKLLKVIIPLVMLVGLIGTAHSATSILFSNEYFSEYGLGPEPRLEAFGGLESDHSVTHVASSSHFSTHTGSRPYNPGIFIVQDHASFGFADGIKLALTTILALWIIALGRRQKAIIAMALLVITTLLPLQAKYGFARLLAFVAGGGKPISSDLSTVNRDAFLFGASWTGNYHGNQLKVTGPLAAGIINPVSLSNPGWGYFSMGVNGAPVAATSPSTRGALIIGNGAGNLANGFLPDTFVDEAQAEAQWVQLFANESNYLASPVPVPGALWLLGSGLLGLGVLKRRTISRK